MRMRCWPANTDERLYECTGWPGSILAAAGTSRVRVKVKIYFKIKLFPRKPVLSSKAH